VPSALRFLLVSYWRVRNSIVWPENFIPNQIRPVRSDQDELAVAGELAGVVRDAEEVVVRVRQRPG
jgi:hypothetical protein